MSRLALLSICFAVFAVSEARVTFPYSEVLQANDLVNKAASFKCDDGCKVYVDRGDASLKITQNGVFVANFLTVIGTNGYEPVGLELKSGKNYQIESANANTADFVFYAVSVRAPNYGTRVFVPQETVGVVINGNERFATILSSFNSIRYFGFNGTFTAGYPRIYSTGFDAAKDAGCTPVYQARSQYNAEQSNPVIYSPILTVDFGYLGGFVGDHSVVTNQNTGKNAPLKNAVSSTVYMSPGYVGCDSVGKQVYFSNVKSVKDNFKLDADSLDFTIYYNNVWPDEPIHLQINDDVWDIQYFGSTSFSRHYPKGTFDVNLSWTRSTDSSSWALQMDFGTVPDPIESTTERASKTTAIASTASSPSAQSTMTKISSTTSGTVNDGVSTTTKDVRDSLYSCSMFVVLLMMLMR